MKYFSPYSRFRVVVNGREYYFHEASLVIPEGNKQAHKDLKQVPEHLGEIRNAKGEVVNRRKITTPKKEAKKTSTKQKPSAKTGGSNAVNNR